MDLFSNQISENLPLLGESCVRVNSNRHLADSRTGFDGANQLIRCDDRIHSPIVLPHRNFTHIQHLFAQGQGDYSGVVWSTARVVSCKPNLLNNGFVRPLET